MTTIELPKTGRVDEVFKAKLELVNQKLIQRSIYNTLIYLASEGLSIFLDRHPELKKEFDLIEKNYVNNPEEVTEESGI